MELVDYQTFKEILEKTPLFKNVSDKAKTEAIINMFNHMNMFTVTEIEKAAESLVDIYSDVTVTGTLKI